MMYVGFATRTRFLALKVGGTAKMPEAPAGGGFGRSNGAENREDQVK